MHQLLEPKGASRAFKQEEVWNAERTLAQRSREDRDLGSTQPRRVAERDRPSCRPQPGGRTASGQPDRRRFNVSTPHLRHSRGTPTAAGRVPSPGAPQALRVMGAGVPAALLPFMAKGARLRPEARPASPASAAQCPLDVHHSSNEAPPRTVEPNAPPGDGATMGHVQAKRGPLRDPLRGWSLGATGRASRFPFGASRP